MIEPWRLQCRQKYLWVRFFGASSNNWIVGGDRGVRISRLLYPYLLPPVPFCPASPASFIGNILILHYTKKGQVKESYSKADFCQGICVICVFWCYMQIKQHDVNIVIYYIFFNVLSAWSPASSPLKTPASRSFLSRLLLFPLLPPVAFLLGSRPPVSPNWISLETQIISNKILLSFSNILHMHQTLGLVLLDIILKLLSIGKAILEQFLSIGKETFLSHNHPQ